MMGIQDRDKEEGPMKKAVRKIVKGDHTQDGAGVKLVRVISRPDVELFDPFLLLDAFDSHHSEDYVKGFPWHPHRGIETVTYLIHGEIEHGDSIGNVGRINDGECQWMTAGSGILHQEMPKPSERMLGVQLWLNLPAKDKMTEPKYRDIVHNEVPVVNAFGKSVKVISGEYAGQKGAVNPDYVQMTFLDVHLSPETPFVLDVTKGDNCFIYIVEGSGVVESEEEHPVSSKQAVLMGEGDYLHLKSDHKGLRFLFFSGAPLKEGIAWGGPIVMNTKEELNQAFKELEQGHFLKHR